MKEEISYLKAKIKDEDWETARKGAIQTIVKKANVLCKKNGTVQFNKTDLCDAVLFYQKFRRTDYNILSTWYTPKEFDTVMGTLHGIINSIPQDEFYLFLRQDLIELNVKKAKNGIEALNNCQSLREFKPDIKKDKEEAYKFQSIHTDLFTYMQTIVSQDVSIALNNLDCYGNILAYTKTNKINCTNKDDWGLYWDSIEILDQPITGVLVNQTNVPAFVASLRSDLYEIDPILDHTTTGLFDPILYRIYERTKKLDNFFERFQDAMENDNDDNEGEEWKQNS